MTDNEKKQEEKVFSQEVAENELESVSGGDCGLSAYMNGPCPKGAIYVQRCPNSVNNVADLEASRPRIADAVLPDAVLAEEVLKKEDK